MQEGWQRAWHGAKLEAFYSTVYSGRLLESKSAVRGARFLHGAPGVYLHRADNRGHADHCCRFVKLDPSGLFYAVKWEVKVNRQGQVTVLGATCVWSVVVCPLGLLPDCGRDAPWRSLVYGLGP